MELYQGILAAAAAVTALGVLWRALHLGELLRGTRLFLLDWQGEPERPGVSPARPSIPARLVTLEERTAVTERRTAALNHELRGDLMSRLLLISEGQALMQATADRNADALARLDERVTDHRRRNEQQIDLLRADVDRRLSSISGDLLRAETYRAALHELGITAGDPMYPPHDPHHDEREAP